MGNIILELQISFFRVCVRVCNLEEFADGLRPLVVKCRAQHLMVMESSGESRDGLVVPDVGDGVPYFREAPDVASQRFPRGLMEFLQIIFRARLLARCHVILDEDFLEIITRFDGVLL